MPGPPPRGDRAATPAERSAAYWLDLGHKPRSGLTCRRRFVLSGASGRDRVRRFGKASKYVNRACRLRGRPHKILSLIGLIADGPLPNSFSWLPGEGIHGRLRALRVLFAQKSHQVRTRSSARLA